MLIPTNFLLTRYRRMEEFMKAKYNITDIALKEINHMFITDFETYLRTV